MATREIRVRKVIADIRSGMGHVALMDKYKLSPLGLQRLFDELTNLGLLQPTEQSEVISGTQRIKIREVVQDIKSGMSDADLMQKYHVAREVLQSLFKKLLDLKAINRTMLFGEVGLQCDTVVPENVRSLHRYLLDLEIPVYEAGFPETQGRIHDISEKGVGTRGLPARVNEVNTLVVLGDAFGVVEPFEFDAVCRWCQLDQVRGEWTAGYQIVDITERALEEVQKIIKLSSFGQ
jgi:uncharacterized protein (DUF433 family)